MNCTLQKISYLKPLCQLGQTFGGIALGPSPSKSRCAAVHTFSRKWTFKKMRWNCSSKHLFGGLFELDKIYMLNKSNYLGENASQISPDFRTHVGQHPHGILSSSQLVYVVRHWTLIQGAHGKSPATNINCKATRCKIATLPTNMSIKLLIFNFSFEIVQERLSVCTPLYSSSYSNVKVVIVMSEAWTHFSFSCANLSLMVLIEKQYCMILGYTSSSQRRNQNSKYCILPQYTQPL